MGRGASGDTPALRRGQQLPERILEQVFHIGSLNAAKKGSVFSTSLEAHGLSVSLDPEEWERIAKLGGNRWWALNKRHGRFVDAHALADAEREQIRAWACEHGYAVMTSAYKVSYTVDDEDGISRRYQLFTDKTVAESEYGYYADDESAEAAFEEIETIAGSEQLQMRIGMRSSLVDIDDHLLVLYVDEETDFDGVWWQDDYGSLAAPRGVIVPRALPTWQRAQIR